MEDRSLDDFVGAGEPDEGADDAEAVEDEPGDAGVADDADGEPDAAESDAEGPEIDGESDGSGATGGDSEVPEAGDDVEPAAATARVDPDGVACPDCGERVERRWRTDDGEFVCAACTEW